MRAWSMIVMGAIALAAPGQARDLAVPSDKGWQHAGSGVVLRATLIGLPRTSLADAGQGEWDVSAQFEDHGRATSLTVYVFHPAAMNVPLWFDRARTALERRDTYGGVTPLSPPVAFAGPSAVNASALRQAFATRKGPYRSTGLAVVPVGEWLIALRLSSVGLDAAALDAKLAEAVVAIGFPAGTTSAPAAVPIVPCPTSLTFAKAKQKKPDIGQALFAGILSAAAASKKGEPAPATREPLCRDGEPTAMWGVFRAPSTTDGYLLALGDSGRTVSVFKTFVSPDLPNGYAVALHDLDGSTANFPYFDKLPRPEQVLDAVVKGSPISAMTAADKQVTLTIDGGVGR